MPVPGHFDTFDPENAIPLVGYLASPRAAQISGYVFIIWGRSLRVVHGPQLGEEWTGDEQWDADSIHAVLEPFIKDRGGVIEGGYSLAAM